MSCTRTIQTDDTGRSIDERHHGVVVYTELVTAGCVLGKSDQDIATALDTMIKRNAAYNDQRRKEMALFAKSGIASPQQSADPRAVRAGGRARTSSRRE
jgi:hypothetical protein